MKDSNFFYSPKGEDKTHAYQSGLEKQVKRIITPFQEYIRGQIVASIALFSCTIIALLWASIPILSRSYEKFIQTNIGFHLENFSVNLTLHDWENDILLTLFFFFIGLEIKREFLVGELAHYKKSLFVLFSALGGMIVPAALYLLINYHTTYQFGWGIPMATDTAFALGILICFKRALPKGIFTFMASLAIVDDIGSILVIALFYTATIQMRNLFLCIPLIILMAALNYSGIRKPWPYMIVGIIIWALIESAGIHGTLAGILVAFFIPARPEVGPRKFLDRINELTARFEKRKEETPLILEDQEQHLVLEQVQEVAQQSTTPLQRWESKLELPTTLIVLPLFALVNAGIPISWPLIKSVFFHRFSLGIFLGLLLGKPAGIILFSRFSLWLKLGKLPDDMVVHDIVFVAILAGIGFTISLFIANLTFSQSHHLLIAKASILLASLLSGVIGFILLTVFKIKRR